MKQQTVFFLLILTPVLGIGNNADLIWYDNNGQERHYFARQPFPEGINETEKIILKQNFPILWEVRFDFSENLEFLIMNNCGIMKLEPGTFRQLKPLTNLSLASNELKIIKVGVFNTIEIKNLDLSHNNLQFINGRAFDDMPVLEAINLDFNELRKWSPEWFFNSTNLGSVSIKHNFLEELPPKAFKNLQDSVSVYFSYNKISLIDREVFDGAPTFKHLYLDWNDLLKIDGHVFGKLKFVEHLNVNGDTLMCLSDEFMNVVLNKTKFVSALENPFKCDCLQELQKREEKIRAKVAYTVGTNCH